MATVRKLIVEVVEARNLLPIDGNGTSSPYVQIDFYGQRKRTRTKIRDLNPTWNELLEFNVGKPSEVFGDMLEVDIYHDRKHGQTRKNNFLGRIRLNSTQFVSKGEEALMYFPLEKKNFFYWVRGDIGLKIYFVDEVVPPPTQPPQPPVEEVKPELPSPPPVDSPAPPENEPKPPSEANGNEESAAPPPEPTAPADAQKPNEEPPADAKGASNLAPEAAPPTENVAPDQVEKPTEVSESEPSQPTEKNEDQTDQPPLIECKQPYPRIGMMATSVPKLPDSAPEASFSKISCPKPIKMTMGREKFTALDPTESMKIEPPSFELVEKMHYLFVRVVKARSLPTNGNPVVKILASSHHVRSKPARKTDHLFVWNQTFAFGHDAPDSSSLLEVTVWDPPPKSPNSDKHGHGTFLGWVGFDVTEIPLRDPPDSPLATQWYRLEGKGPHSGDLMLATWVGTQADEAFPDACKTDMAYTVNSQAKVYQSPKLWYLRATVLDAQDILPLMASKESCFQVRAQLGFQVSKTKLSVSRNGTLSWNEDLMFVTAEPSNDHLVLTLENRQPKATVTIGVVRIPLTAIERRVDDRPISSTWFSFEDPDKEKRMYKGRVQLRLCFDGGYHVMDEATHICSDYRPTARQLWKLPIGKVELGIISCKNLTPMKTVSGKGSTDAYCVAKYGSKWVRTRTVFDSLDPKWNEQYTWQVYDPCTVLTIGVFDSWAVHGMEEGSKESTRPDFCIGMVRVRLSTLQTGKVYRSKYPLLVLYNSGMKQMGEVEIAIRFARSVPTMDIVHVYSQPLLPLMHHIKPLGMDQQDMLRNTTVKIIAAHLSRSEPPLRREVVFYMLDADTHAFSMRKLRVNWFRIANEIAGLIDIARWINDTRLWKNPTSTILVHALFVMLVWFPDLIVPTLAFYVFVIGGWNYRFRARDSLPHFDTQISLVDTVDRDELDEEFDTVPCNRPNEVVRARYDKLRIIGARVQRALGDIATQGERAQALVTWRDPRASGIFVGLCFVVAMILYMVPSKMVAMAFGFYYFRHPLFRNRMPSPALNFFRRLPSLADRII